MDASFVSWLTCQAFGVGSYIWANVMFLESVNFVITNQYMQMYLMSRMTMEQVIFL